MKLTPDGLELHDVQWCIRRLPKKVAQLLIDRGPQIFLAGGFIRSVIANEEVSDIDLFAPSADAAEAAILALKVAGYGYPDADVIKTENAFTLPARMPVQIIHRWVYDSPQACVRSFDFTVAAAAIWHADNLWHSMAHESFYADLAAKRLVYLAPVRNEDAGGSILRVLKFYQKGYRIPIPSLGAVIARLVMGVKDKNDVFGREDQMAKVLTGLLREVDPNVGHRHTAYIEELDDSKQA